MDIIAAESVVPPSAALLSNEYPQFTEVAIPAGSTARSAWIGEIQPYSSDACARAFLHAIELDEPIWVSGGRIRESDSSKAHWANALLVRMSTHCKVLILVEPPPAHPKAYLLRPLFAEHYAQVHPHPRVDQQISWGGRTIPGLCIYSAAEFEYDRVRDRVTQFLDQVTLYVARHLIWLRTRQLFRGYPPTGRLIRSLLPGETLFDDRPTLVIPGSNGQKTVLDFWRGYWPGPIARGFDAASHLKTIKPEQECWCGRGLVYRDCHRSDDLLRQRAQLRS